MVETAQEKSQTPTALEVIVDFSRHKGEKNGPAAQRAPGNAGNTRRRSFREASSQADDANIGGIAGIEIWQILSDQG
jgi:hypothetical protein